MDWKKRSRKDKVRVIKRAETGIDKLKELLYLNYKDVQNQIKQFYEKYGENPYEQLNLLDVNNYKSNLQNNAKKFNKDKTLKKILREDAPKYKIDRLRALETELQIQLSYITQRQEQGIRTTLMDVANFSNALTVKRFKDGFGIVFDTINQRKLRQIVNQVWIGRFNWSERIWKDRELLGVKLTKVLNTGMVQGKSLQSISAELKGLTNNSFYNAFRLIRTETAHVDNQVTYEQMVEAQSKGLTNSYTFIATDDDRTCDECDNESLKDKVIAIDDAIEGENYPPLHPNCRCCVVIIPNDEIEIEYTDKETNWEAIHYNPVDEFIQRQKKYD